MQSFDGSIRHLLDIQGGCERINNTPLPASYGFIAERLIMADGILLPLGLVFEISNAWRAIPLTVLVCLSFERINLRQRLGEEDLPDKPEADARGILMSLACVASCRRLGCSRVGRPGRRHHWFGT